MKKIKCPNCQSSNIDFQYIRKGMTFTGVLCFLAFLCGGLTIPVAIWYIYNANKLRLYCVCKNCKQIWECKEQ